MANIPGIPSSSSTASHDEEAFQEALDDVHTRFLLNLPPEELASADRIFFQIEQAWWFYEDMICDTKQQQKEQQQQASAPLSYASAAAAAPVPANAGVLPRYSTLKPFAWQLFQFSPLLENARFAQMWAAFSEYKRKISTYGTILLNNDGTRIVLVQTWTGHTWTLPAGKINQGEKGIEAAARECYEETGFDPNGQAGPTKDWNEDPSQKTRITWKLPLQEKHALAYQDANGKRRTCYVCWGVPEDFDFAPVARKEVSKVDWFPLDDLPKKTFAVLPLMGKLRKWIRKNIEKNNNKSPSRSKSNGRDKSNSRKASNGHGKRSGSSTKDRRPSSASSLVDAGLLAEEGGATRWTEEEMFRANEALLGRKVDYDGNPHVFAEQGFRGNDPHAFRVVGGGFMNSDGESDGAPRGSIPAATSANSQATKYQSLVHTASSAEGGSGNALPLTPFFTEDGATPWGEVVAEAKISEPSSTTAIDSGEALLQMLQGGSTGESLSAVAASSTKSSKRKKNKKSKSPSQNQQQQAVGSDKDSEDPNDGLDVLTDAQITRKSQARYLDQQQQKTKSMQDRYQKDMAYIDAWVSALNNPVGFKIQNSDAIMERYFGPAPSPSSAA